MTPISPATNATSFLTVDSADDDDDDKKSAGSLSRSERDPGSSTRPSTSDPSAEPDNKASPDPSHLSASQADDGSKSQSSAVVGSGPNTISSPQSTTPAGSVTDESYPSHSSPPREDSNQHLQTGEEPAPRRLPKKRSRLRLAFWRRRNHHSHQQEVSGET